MNLPPKASQLGMWLLEPGLTSHLQQKGFYFCKDSGGCQRGQSGSLTCFQCFWQSLQLGCGDCGCPGKSHLLISLHWSFMKRTKRVLWAKPEWSISMYHTKPLKGHYQDPYRNFHKGALSTWGTTGTLAWILKRECALRPSHIKTMWHMMKNQFFFIYP